MIAVFLIGAAAVLLLAVMITPLNASADDKQYQINSADFTIELETNGDAVITEEWQVQYVRGSFTRFYKDIFYDSSSQLEYIRDVQVQSCSINGREAAAQNNTDRNDGHYYLEKNAAGYTIHWFQAAENQTVQYAVTYRIPGAVKLNIICGYYTVHSFRPDKHESAVIDP